MSDIDALVSEIGFHVEQLTNQLEEEKKHYSDVQNKLSNILKEVGSKADVKSQIEEEIKQLESSYFEQVRHSEEIEGVKDALAKQVAYLKQALEDIKNSNEAIRKERGAFVAQCRSKLKSYDDQLWQNEKLRLFVDTWMKKSSDFQLKSLPKTIIETAQRLNDFYEKSLETSLEKAFDCVPVFATKELTESSSPTTVVTQQSEPSVSSKNLKNGDESFFEDASRLRLSALDTSALIVEVPIQKETKEAMDVTIVNMSNETSQEPSTY